MEMSKETREATIEYVRSLKTSVVIILMVNKEAIRQAVSKAQGQQYADSMRKEDFEAIADICANEVDRRMPLIAAEEEPAEKQPNLWKRALRRLRIV